LQVRAGFKSEELDLETRAYKSRGVQRKEALEGYVPGAAPAQAGPAKKTEAEKRKERRQRKKQVNNYFGVQHFPSSLDLYIVFRPKNKHRMLKRS